MLRKALFLFIISTSLASNTFSQKFVTGEEVQADPKSFQGKKVFVYVDGVTFPAKRVNTERGFSEYWVVTAADASWGQTSKNGTRTIGDRDKSGGLFVRVPATDIDKFNKEYSAKAGKAFVGARKKITGTYRANSSGEGGFLDLTDGTSADIDAPSRRIPSDKKK